MEKLMDSHGVDKLIDSGLCTLVSSVLRMYFSFSCMVTLPLKFIV